jgi:hypothetical protein
MVIPNPGSECFYPVSWIQSKKGTGSRSEFLTQKTVENVRDPGCLFRIHDPVIFPPFRIPDSGVKNGPDPESGFATLRETKKDFRCSVPVLINQNFANRYILNRIQILWNFSEKNGY